MLSVSPELFLACDDRVVTAKPMKGTAPRGRSTVEDLDQRDRLVDSEKERAGNLMIVDMVRNDLGVSARSARWRSRRCSTSKDTRRSGR